MNRWWWVRHGPTHHAGLVGWSDIAADLSNSDQLNALNNYLPKDALVVSSDLVRCSKTADCLTEGRERLSDSDQLRELSFGDWELKTFADVQKTDPELSKEYWSNPGDISPPNGESWNQTATRICAYVDQMNENYEDKDIVVVAHFGAILTQVQRAAKMSAKSAIAFKIDNLSVTRLDYLGDDAWRIMGVNHIA